MSQAVLMEASKASAEARAWEVLQSVFDPEIPHLSIVELGIVRGVKACADGSAVEAQLTPTYSGCPAVSVIELDAEMALRNAGFPEVSIKRVMAPAWTTDWITDEGRRKLHEAGIAPPAEASTSKRTLLGESLDVECPHCGSHETQQLSEFGSTACKALWRCKECLEPFDYFKCI